ncbi:MAG: hypothetical protein WC222_02015 [Parachlamydiales bacterium]|jgi:hypothetical protein
MGSISDFNSEILPELTRLLNDKTPGNKKNEIINAYQRIRAIVKTIKENVNTGSLSEVSSQILALEAMQQTLIQFHQCARDKKILPKQGWLSFLKPIDDFTHLQAEIQNEIRGVIKHLSSQSKKTVVTHSRQHPSDDIKKQSLSPLIKAFYENIEKEPLTDRKQLQNLVDDFGFKSVLFGFIDAKLWNDYLLDLLNALDQHCSFFERIFLIRKSEYDKVALKSAQNFKVVTLNEVLKGLKDAQNHEKIHGVSQRDEQTILLCRNLLKVILNSDRLSIHSKDTIKEWIDLRNTAKTVSFEIFELERMENRNLKVVDKLESFLFHLPKKDLSELIQNTSQVDIQGLLASEDPKVVQLIQQIR